MSDSPFTPPGTEDADRIIEVIDEAPASTANRRNAALAAGGAAALLAIAGWFVLPTGAEEPVSEAPPGISAPSGPTTAPEPTTQATDLPLTIDVDQVTGRDPFVPLVGEPAAPAAPIAIDPPFGSPVIAAPEETPPGSAPLEPTVTPTPTPTPAPAGKKKPVPTSGPVL